MAILNKARSFLKQETVLLISALFAVISMFCNPPSVAYLNFIDFRVLCLLFCLMAVVLGFQYCGLFSVLAQKLLAGRKNFRLLSLVLVLLPFFCAMLVTNDVALITFVPFTILVLKLTGQSRYLIYIVVLQTLAANLGSMATPVGNPQNLYLYAYFGISAGAFFSIMLPLTSLSGLALIFFSLVVKNRYIEVAFSSQEHLKDKKRLVSYIVLFVLCLLSVFRLLPYYILTAVVILTFLIFSPRLLKKVDFSLLLTFVCFFIFAGNIGQIPQVRELLGSFMEKSPLLTSIAASQVISNVPTAVLLSGFTNSWQQLLLGVNVGGMGTPIASLASLISLKIYLASENPHPLKYILVFAFANIIGLLVLIPAAMLLLK